MQCFASELIASYSFAVKSFKSTPKPWAKKMPCAGKKNNPKTKQKLIVSECICSNGTAVLANPAGHNHQKALVSLPDHNNSNRVEDCSLTFILELHCGTRERSLCCVLCVYVRLTGAEPPHRECRDSSDAVWRLTWPESPKKTPTLVYRQATPSCGEDSVLQKRTHKPTRWQRRSQVMRLWNDLETELKQWSDNGQFKYKQKQRTFARYSKNERGEH